MTPKDVDLSANRMVEQIAAAADKTLEELAALQQRRAERLSMAQQRVAAELGPDHPRVLALARSAGAAQGLRESLRGAAARQARQPRIGAHEWLVFGRVRTADLQPAVSVSVRVFDRDRKYDDLLGQTFTDERGEFAVVYHERDFAEQRENLPELYLLIEDERGNELYASRDQVRFEASRVEYFDVVLPREASGAGAKPSRPRTPARPKSGAKKKAKPGASPTRRPRPRPRDEDG
jgi:hypothetical protein